MNLLSHIQALPDQQRISVASIVSALNKRPTAIEEGAEEQAKPEAQAALEASLRAILTALGVPTPIPAGTMLNLLQATPENDEQRDMFTRAIAIRGELVGIHGLTDDDFRAADFGQPARTVPTRTVKEGQSIAEANGLTVTRETVIKALRG